jgi:hypothetical protein
MIDTKKRALPWLNASLMHVLHCNGTISKGNISSSASNMEFLDLEQRSLLTASDFG